MRVSTASTRLLLTCVLFAVHASAARAEPSPPLSDDDRKNQARDLAQRGDELLEAKSFAEAEATFRKALALVDAPTLKLRLARSIAGQHRDLEAKAAYVALTNADLGPSPPPPFVEAIGLATLDLAELQAKIPTVRVSALQGESASITIDGRAASAGADVEVDPGEHVVAALGAITRHVTVAEGDHAKVELAGAEAPFPYRTTAAPAIALAAGGLFGIGIGVGFGIDALRIHGELDDACPKSACAPSSSPLHDRFETSGNVATAMLVVGGASVVASVIVFAVGKPLGPTVSAGLNGVKITTNF
jgi:hypothetical protein